MIVYLVQVLLPFLTDPFLQRPLVTAFCEPFLLLVVKSHVLFFMILGSRPCRSQVMTISNSQHRSARAAAIGRIWWPERNHRETCYCGPGEQPLDSQTSSFSPRSMPSEAEGWGDTQPMPKSLTFFLAWRLSPKTMQADKCLLPSVTVTQAGSGYHSGSRNPRLPHRTSGLALGYSPGLLASHSLQSWTGCGPLLLEFGRDCSFS